MIKGLYIHIPFCDQICTYCDFCKMVTSTHNKKEYMKALVKEMEYYSDLLEHIETIYIGGGTPSSIDDDLMDAFLDELDILVDMTHIKEFTIEANPNDITPNFLEILRKHHVTRVSMGVQSMSEDLLRFLGRTHTDEIVEHAIDLIKTSGLNFNLDFLYAIPGQSLEDLKKDLDYIKKFKAHHISYYSLILEDRTVLNYLINKHKVEDFPDDLAREYGELIDIELEKLGYHKYEFSNYAKAGYESKHNLIYWNLEEYLGIGLNASSQFNNTRMINPTKLSVYLKGIQDKSLTMHNIEDFNPKLETLLVGLRKTEGISMSAYKERFKKGVFDIYPQLKKFLDSNLLEIQGDYLRFTSEGIYLSNQVYVDII
ncbi:MAG: radical SAM family heme chaperone HemW [Candidatus Izemoplasmatales bacterium]|uniref:Heme chaperone HemW n=1 Tax=Hujiaoplasma nucleasis TaxID=2725268 RepID=A0A7L6N041_9MOLU|nr:radical SAM family heme chaperone HemW [Hujiaoplasma nucleasis]QLY39616.1 radical SAM family heme chaperone HemW [Hujiaoplasma nucleasis]